MKEGDKNVVDLASSCNMCSLLYGFSWLVMLIKNEVIRPQHECYDAVELIGCRSHKGRGGHDLKTPS